jgi:cellulose synthase/poly-beta-1,6-N-acetylglucosamine synthase-like glycosyltransferase
LRGSATGPDSNPHDILNRLRRAAQRAAALAPEAPLQHEYAFLVGSLIDRATLARAEAEAVRCGVATHEVLLASGWISELDYVGALARELAVPALPWEGKIELRLLRSTDRQRFELAARIGPHTYGVLAAMAAGPSALREHIAQLRATARPIVLASQTSIDAALEEAFAQERIDRAVTGLLRQRPPDSAASPFATWQLFAAPFLVGLPIGGFLVFPEATLAALAAIMAFPFLCVTLLRAWALREVLTPARARARRKASRPRGRLEDRVLPVYSVLVPLFRETEVLPGLVQSLRALDYPAAKLEVLLVLEESDWETQTALLGLELPGNFRTIIVPDGQPRTKPKALNYALQFARGEFIVVYDAEDRPHSGQLRRALELFRYAPRGVACVQAQLNIYNPSQNWLTRQFTIEYSALFDAVLPALERLRLPVPLGGTSNHFPARMLTAAGAWDPFNVTEDADLGIRLARQGWRTSILHSTTWEEAPASFTQWLKQRTRWLKGWMQTYLVHTRRPGQLAAELGSFGTLGFHALMGGLILSALVHPLFYALLAHYAWSGQLFAPAETSLARALWTIASINLVAGYGVSIVVGMLAVWRRGRPGLALHALFMPLYWLLISLAAYRALYQLVRTPYLWEKTTHGAGLRQRARAGNSKQRA